MPIIATEEQILSELPAIKNGRKNDPENTRRALRSLYYALKESQHYYESVIQRRSRDPITEKQLKMYWDAADISMKRIRNEKMVKICAKSSFYFINADSWISEYERGFKMDFSNLVAALSNAVGVSNRSNWKSSTAE